MASFLHDESRPMMRHPRRTDREKSRQCLHSQEKSVLNTDGHGVVGAGPRGRGGGSGRSGDSRKRLDWRPKVDGQENTQACPNEIKRAFSGARRTRSLSAPGRNLSRVFHLPHASPAFRGTALTRQRLLQCRFSTCLEPKVGPCNVLFSFFLVFFDACVLSHLVISDSLWPHGWNPPGSLSSEFSRQEYWSGFPFPTSWDLPNPGIELESLSSPVLAADCLPLVPPGKPSVDHF